MMKKRRRSLRDGVVLDPELTELSRSFIASAETRTLSEIAMSGPTAAKLDRSALEYLYKAVGEMLVAEGPCPETDPDEVYCGRPGCYYCAVAYAHERIRKIKEDGGVR